jgi:hypothetical protein
VYQNKTGILYEKIFVSNQIFAGEIYDVDDLSWNPTYEED